MNINFYKDEYENLRRNMNNKLQKEKDINIAFLQKTMTMLQILVDKNIFTWKQILDYYRS